MGSLLTINDLEQVAPRVAQMELNMIETTLEDPEDIDCKQRAVLIEDAGLGVSVCVAITRERDLKPPDETVRANGEVCLKRCIEATQVLGGGPCTRR